MPSTSNVGMADTLKTSLMRRSIGPCELLACILGADFPLGSSHLLVTTRPSGWPSQRAQSASSFLMSRRIDFCSWLRAARELAIDAAIAGKMPRDADMAAILE